MQVINEQYKVARAKSLDSYGTTYVVEDIQKDNLLKHLRVIELQSDTRDFIEYMKNNFNDYSMYYHRNLIDFHFFNRIKMIDYKSVTVNQYYYTYEYFDGIKVLEYCADKSFNTVMDLIAELCSAVKYLHLRGFLLCSLKMDELMVASDSMGDHLKILSLPYPVKTSHRVMIDKDTPYFTAPEVWNGSDYSIQSDVYLVGAIAFYLLTGTEPSEERLESIISHYESVKNNTIDSRLINIVKKCAFALLNTLSMRWCLAIAFILYFGIACINCF